MQCNFAFNTDNYDITIFQVKLKFNFKEQLESFLNSS